MIVKEQKKRLVDDAVRKFDRDLKSCMNCRFFIGNDSRCINNKFCKEEEIIIKPIVKEKSECDNCPYKQEGGYCFPCMKKLLA